MKVTAVPTVPVDGPLMVTPSAPALITIVAVAVAVFAFASVAVTDTV